MENRAPGKREKRGPVFPNVIRLARPRTREQLLHQPVLSHWRNERRESVAAHKPGFIQYVEPKGDIFQETDTSVPE
jgi:hypothetical protein